MTKEKFKVEILKIENRKFVKLIILNVLLYFLFSFFLNKVRASISLFILYPMIFIQFYMLFLVFKSCYNRMIDCGLNKYLSYITFILICATSRINNLEIIVIPIMIIITILISTFNKNLSNVGEFAMKEYDYENEKITSGEV